MEASCVVGRVKTLRDWYTDLFVAGFLQYSGTERIGLNGITAGGRRKGEVGCDPHGFFPRFPRRTLRRKTLSCERFQPEDIALDLVLPALLDPIRSPKGHQMGLQLVSPVTNGRGTRSGKQESELRSQGLSRNAKTGDVFLGRWVTVSKQFLHGPWKNLGLPK